MMRWFGPSTAAPFYVADLGPRVNTPAGESCRWCEERIDKSDFGLFMNGLSGPEPYHWECQARQLIGSLAHIEKRCSCYVPGATCTDPDDISRRDAAKLAVQAFRRCPKMQT